LGSASSSDSTLFTCCPSSSGSSMNLEYSAESFSNSPRKQRYPWGGSVGEHEASSYKGQPPAGAWRSSRRPPSAPTRDDRGCFLEEGP
jgi:hypothetical protein